MCARPAATGCQLMAAWFSPAAPRVRDDEQVVAAMSATLPANLCLEKCPAPWWAPAAKNPGRPVPSPQAPATKHLAPNQPANQIHATRMWRHHCRTMPALWWAAAWGAVRAAMWAATPAPNDGATGTLQPATGGSAVATAGKLVMQEPRRSYVRQSTWSRETPWGLVGGRLLPEEFWSGFT